MERIKGLGQVRVWSEGVVVGHGIVGFRPGHPEYPDAGIDHVLIDSLGGLLWLLVLPIKLLEHPEKLLELDLGFGLGFSFGC